MVNFCLQIFNYSPISTNSTFQKTEYPFNYPVTSVTYTGNIHEFYVLSQPTVTNTGNIHEFYVLSHQLHILVFIKTFIKTVLSITHT